MIENTEIKISDRTGVALLNRLLHRNADNALRLRTVTNMCDRNGNQVLEYQKDHARSILEAHHFDLENGQPTSNADIVHLQESAEDQPTQSEKTLNLIDQYVAEYNQGKKDGIHIEMTEDQKSAIEDPDGKTVVISLDEVGAKKQKDTRKKSETNDVPHNQDSTDDLSAPPASKGRPSVETSVAHISVGDLRYVLISDSMLQLCLSVLAFLLESDLLGGYKLIFMTDGASNIRKALESVFGFRSYTVLLDWFHLRKHCTEGVSLFLKSGKENRETQYTVKRILFRNLWCGNVAGAIEYLSSLPADIIRNESRRNELIDYLNRKQYAIQCYAVRCHLGLPISSNPVEKANDLTVARRQKKKSMSWSTHGSHSLAALTVLYMNNEAHNWHNNGTLSFGLYKKYGDGLAA